MRPQQEDLTRTLASALWRSAFSPYSRALDTWLAAEEMVAEALRGGRAVPEGAGATPSAPIQSLPSGAFPVDYVRDLAQCFWEHSARSAALTLDIWLAAERHVGVLCQTALAGHGALQPFSAEAYWWRIRDHAERLWHVQGRPNDRDFDTWLQAEAKILQEADDRDDASVAAAAREGSDESDPAQSLALTVLTEDGGAAPPPWHSPAGPERAAAQPGL